MKIENLLIYNILGKNLFINYRNDVFSKNVVYSLNNYIIKINDLNKSYINIKEKRFIRVGKYDNLVSYKNILKEENKNIENEKKKNYRDEKNILEVLDIDDLKISQPKKFKKKVIQNDMKKKNDDKGFNLNSNLSENRKMETGENEIKIIKNNMENKKKNIKGNYKIRIINKRMKEKGMKNIKEQIFKNKEEQTINEKVNKYNKNIDYSKNYNNDNTNSNNNNNIGNNKKLCTTKKKNFKRFVLLNNYVVTNSYINKKFYICIKKKGEKSNDFDLSEMKSMELLSEVKKINKKKNEKTEMKKEIREFQKDSVSYENKDKIIKKIYKASINHVRDEILWKKYVQNTFIISVYLDASDIVILFWCFGKIGYRDNRLINLLCSIILKKINELNACALALLLNSFKKLEIKKFDTIELLTNQFCFHISKWTFQDIALVSNALSFFYIYHKIFWKKCILKLQRNYYFSHPLHLCLVISAFSRLDIREGNILLCMSKSAKKLAKEFSPNNLSLVIHSFAKLKFHHPKFYNYLYQYVHMYLDRQLLTYESSNIISTVHSSEILEEQLNEESEDLSCEKNINLNKLNRYNIPRTNKHIEDKLIFNEHSSNDNTTSQYTHGSYVNVQNKNNNKILKEKIIINDNEGNDKQVNYNKNSDKNINGILNENMLKLDKKNTFFDLQSLVLLLFSSVCLINCTEQMILKLTYLIIPHKNHLGDHKVDKLKYVSDYLQYVFPSTFEKFPKEIKIFYHYIDNYEIKKKNFKHSARWINELSRILVKINVDHSKNVYINNICANIMLTNSNVIINCLGPYSYYVNSLVSTAISDLKTQILEKKKYKVVTLSYHEWNNLNDYDEKIKFLYAFGRNAANYFFLNSKKENLNTNKSCEINNTDDILLKEKSDIENGQNDLTNNSIENYDEPIEDTEVDNYSSDEDTEIINFIKKTKYNTENDLNTNIDEEISSIKNLLALSKK